MTSSGSADSGYEESRLFCCPEEGCTKSFVYHRNLEHHLDTGKHVYRQKRPVTDDVKEMWIDRVREVKDSYSVSIDGNQSKGLCTPVVDF